MDCVVQWTQNSGQQEDANTQLIGTNKTTTKKDGWFHWEMGGQVIARAQRPEICDTMAGW